jgi:sporulation protein YunB
MKKKRRQYAAPAYIVVFVAVLALIFTLDVRLRSSILELAQAKVQLQTVELINTVIQEEIAAQADYQDLFTIHKDSEGRIVMIQANTQHISAMVAQTSAEVARRLNVMGDGYIGIPLGQLTGSQLLSAYGPKLKVKILPAGQVDVQVENSFESAGINQTRHIVHFRVNTTVTIAVPYLASAVEATADIPLAETIIVGQVPNTYMQWDAQSQSLSPYFFQNQRRE